MVKNLPADAGDTSSIPALGRSSWRRKWQSTPVFLPGKSHGQRALEGYSPKGCKESETTEQLLFALSRVILGLNIFQVILSAD